MAKNDYEYEMLFCMPWQGAPFFTFVLNVFFMNFTSFVLSRDHQNGKKTTMNMKYLLVGLGQCNLFLL